MGQLPVVGDEQQAGGILVQAAGGEKPPAAQALREQVQHGFLAAVLCGGKDSRRFVQHDGEEFLVGAGLDFGAGVPLGGAVDQHRPGADELPHLLAGAQALGSQEFIQPFPHCSTSFLYSITILYDNDTAFNPRGRRPLGGAPRRLRCPGLSLRRRFPERIPPRFQRRGGGDAAFPKVGAV